MASVQLTLLHIFSSFGEWITLPKVMCIYALCILRLSQGKSLERILDFLNTCLVIRSQYI